MFVYSFIYFIVCIFQFGGSVEENVTHYLTNSSDFVSNLLKANKKILGNGVSMEFYDIQPLNINETYKNIHVFSLFNVTHFLMGTHIYVLNDNFSVQYLKSFNAEKGDLIEFTKAANYKTFGIIAFAFTNSLLEIYIKQKNDAHLNHLHSIAVKCNDLHFFEENSTLFLVIASTAGACKGICIFKWVTTHFDKIKEVPDLKVISITSFPTDEGRIIVALQKNTPSIIFLYENNNILRKKQCLKTVNASQVVSYKIGGEHHIVILDDIFLKTYLWNTTEFFLFKTFKYPKIEKIYVYYYNNHPIIFAKEDSKLNVYKPIVNGGTQQNITIDLQRYHTNIFFPIQNNNDNILFVLESKLKVALLPFSLHFNRTFPSKKTEEINDNLLDCLKQVGNILLKGEDRRKITRSAKSKSIVNNSIAQREKLNDLQDYCLKLKEDVDKMQQKVHRFIEKPTFQGALITGNLVAQTLETHFLWNVKKINNNTWPPNSWLFYNGQQIITTPVFINTIIVKNLQTSPNDPLFTDLLLRNGNQTLTGKNTFSHFKANEIMLNVINKIPFEKIYLKSKNIKIKGRKIFDSLQAKKVTITTLNKKLPYKILNTLSNFKLNFTKRLNVENLIVTHMNNVTWNKFNNLLFKLGKSTTITGNLKINQLNVNKLKTKTVNNVKVNYLFIKTIDQEITSFIHFQNVDAVANFSCSTLNGLDMQKDVIAFKPDNVITVKGPVSIKTLKVYKKLYINSSKHGFRQKTNNILQIYHENVKIIGKVQLYNVSLDYHTEIIVNGHHFQVSMLRNYWLKNHFQKIPVHVTFQKGASVPHLNIKSLNSIDIRDYMVQNVDNERSVHFYFENVTVFGDVFLNPEKEHCPNLKAIDSGSIKYSGRYNVTGKIVFDNTVTVKHLKTKVLDSIVLNKVLHKYSKAKITGIKNFKDIHVLNNLEAKRGIIMKINDKSLELLETKALYIDKTTKLPHVYLDDLVVENLIVNKLNNIAVNDYIIRKNLKQINDTIVSLILEGNVTINNAKIDYINKIPLGKLMVQNNTTTILDNLYFPGNIHINYLQVTKINDIQIKQFSKKLLLKNYEQIISAPFSFNNITTDNLYTVKINSISLEHLVETEKQQLNMKKVILNKVRYIKYLKAKTMSCNIEKAIRQLENPATAKWRTVEVAGNLKIFNKSSNILDVLKQIVTTNSNNVIIAPINFEKPIFATTVATAGNINGVNVTKIEHDAIYTTVKGKSITITGANTFHTLKTADVTMHGNAAIKKVNDILVSTVNSSILHKNSEGNYVIRGKKTFLGGLQTNRLSSKIIAGINPDNLVNLKSLRLIPKAAFDSLTVKGNMNIKRINNVDFENFLKDRVLLKSNTLQTLPRAYHFEEIIFNNAIKTRHLNHLSVEDIIVDGDLQNIESKKTFLNSVFLNGNSNFALLNNVNLTQLYENSVFTDQNCTINGNLTITANSRLLDNLNVETLNGVPMERLKTILHYHDPEIVAASTGNALQTIGYIVEQCMDRLRLLPDKFMYIEEVTSLQVGLPPSQNSHLIQLTQNSTLVLLDGQISGQFCGLPLDCPCPIEHSVYFGPNKININNNTNYRVFKYNDNNFSISISTRAVSVNSYCRNGNSKIFNEYSLLSWRNNTTTVKGTRKIPGYLSDTKFFSFDGRVFVILCEYYDPVFDTHELYCTVFKSNEYDNLEVIQYIPVKGAWKVHLLNTTEEIVLVIGNVVPGFSNYTDLYKFNKTVQKFEYLRDIKAIGCTAVTDIILKNDSFIVLAQPKTSVYILKYDHNLKNYYYYQSFSMDSPVFSVSVFYTGDLGNSDVYLCIVTENGDFSIYSFNQIEGLKLESNNRLLGLTDLIPIKINKKSYLFAPSSKFTKLLSIVKQGDV